MYNLQIAINFKNKGINKELKHWGHTLIWLVNEDYHLISFYNASVNI